MKTILGAAAWLAAMGLCVPAYGQVVDCRGDAQAAKTRSMTEVCARNSGEALRNCVKRIDDAYLRAIGRCMGQEQRAAMQASLARARAAEQAIRDQERAEAARLREVGRQAASQRSTQPRR